MALINDTYIFVTTESFSGEMELGQHPVEEGIDLTDHAKARPEALSITGYIVGVDFQDTIDEIESYKSACELVEYVGNASCSNMLITSTSYESSSAIKDGVSFSISLQEVRIASSPYQQGSDNIGLQQVEEGSIDTAEVPAESYTIRKTDTLWKIAKEKYGNGALYPKIFEANRSVISNPDVIQEGWVITIP